MKRVHLTTAPDQLVAEMWRDLLRDQGVSAIIRPGDVSSFMGVSAYPCRILVQQDEHERAKEILGAHLGREID